MSGPALAILFDIAGIACVFAAPCYQNFSILPVEGSAYAYAYGTIGKFSRGLWDGTYSRICYVR